MTFYLDLVLSEGNTFSREMPQFTDSLQFSCNLDTVQDFSIKLGIKPLMHLLEISTFSLNNVIVRLTKIMNIADKNWALF